MFKRQRLTSTDLQSFCLVTEKGGVILLDTFSSPSLSTFFTIGVTSLYTVYLETIGINNFSDDS